MDAVQESMIKIIRNIHMIDDIDSRKCANYIYIIVKRTSLDLYRKKRSEQERTVTEDAFEISELMGLEQIAVRKRLPRARQRLVEIISERSR